jgi:sugar fermentation stimulation protein A
VMLYLVQRTDCAHVKLARDIDPAYYAAFLRAQAAGVDVLALGADISTSHILIAQSLQFKA